MRVKILGCHGGELPGCRTTCFLFNGRVALDAGALTSVLPLPELLQVDDIVLTHAHLDHVKDIPLLSDLLVDQRSEAVRVHALPESLSTLRRSLFNDELWPDFTQLPSAERPALRFLPFEHGETLEVGGLRWTPHPVDHPVASAGFIVEDGQGAVVISGDTGPTQALWEAANGRDDLRAFFIEVSFPNRMQWLADASGHLTPQRLADELKKIHSTAPVFLYHLKPAFMDELRAEIAALDNPRLRILELGDAFEF